MLTLTDLIIFAFVLAAALSMASLFIAYIMMEFMMSKRFWKRYMGRIQELTEMDFDDEDEEDED